MTPQAVGTINYLPELGRHVAIQLDELVYAIQTHESKSIPGATQRAYKKHRHSANWQLTVAVHHKLHGSRLLADRATAVSAAPATWGWLRAMWKMGLAKPRGLSVRHDLTPVSRLTTPTNSGTIVNRSAKSQNGGAHVVGQNAPR
jgi:hypothetical protein